MGTLSYCEDNLCKYTKLSRAYSLYQRLGGAYRRSSRKVFIRSDTTG